MRVTPGKYFAATAAALALISAAPVAAATAAPAQSTSNSWLTLSALNPAGATALGGAVAAQPVEADDNFNIPLPVIGFWVATVAIMIYIATRHKHGHISVRVSPD